MSARLVFNLFAVCGAASFAGAMLMIGLTLGVYWKGLTPQAFLDWFSANAHLIGRIIPLFALPTAVGLIGSLWLDWRDDSARMLWAAALLCALGLGAITAVFHLPTNNALIAKSVPLDDVAATLDRWLWLHAVRTALGLAAAVLGMVAISR
jgi:uncharacterized membrane protein